jgi:DNA-binding MarR family transcriptional regulator/GNAT superfamily N-acetyltransferase
MSTTTPSRIATVRAFNRFYTRRFGMLGSGLLGTTHPLPQARVLYELGQRPETAVTELRAALDLDGGYLSRLLGGLETGGLITRERAPEDGRRQVVRLTDTGRHEFEELDSRSRAEVEELLGRLIAAMHVLEDAWDGRPNRTVTLRQPTAGDLGWIVHRHGALYAREYGWDATFEAYVAGIVADFANRADARERAWIADVNGEPAGCVLCTRKDDSTALLRVLLVEPDARGLGIGARLVEQCVQFAEQAGYTSMTLWTQRSLTAAVRLYQRAGFTLAAEEPHHSFGHDLVGQTWNRALTPTRT